MLKTFSRAVILALSGSLLTAAVAVAAAYPERPITVVVAFAAGGKCNNHGNGAFRIRRSNGDGSSQQTTGECQYDST